MCMCMCMRGVCDGATEQGAGHWREIGGRWTCGVWQSVHAHAHAHAHTQHMHCRTERVRQPSVRTAGDAMCACAVLCCMLYQHARRSLAVRCDAHMLCVVQCLCWCERAHSSMSKLFKQLTSKEGVTTAQHEAVQAELKSMSTHSMHMHMHIMRMKMHTRHGCDTCSLYVCLCVSTEAQQALMQKEDECNLYQNMVSKSEACE